MPNKRIPSHVQNLARTGALHMLRDIQATFPTLIDEFRASVAAETNGAAPAAPPAKKKRAGTKWSPERREKMLAFWARRHKETVKRRAAKRKEKDV